MLESKFKEALLCQHLTATYELFPNCNFCKEYTTQNHCFLSKYKIIRSTDAVFFTDIFLDFT